MGRPLGAGDLDEPVLLVRPDGCVLDANPSAAALLGTGVVGTDLAEHVTDEPAHVRDVLGQQVRSTSPVPATLGLLARGEDRQRVVGRRRSATEAEVVLRFRPGSDRFREITETLDRLNAEITRRLRVESELQQVLGTTVLDLEAANDRLRRFTTVATHDLRSPLTVIVGFAESMTGPGVPPERVADATARIAAAARGCAELVESLHAEALATADAAITAVDLAEELEWVQRLSSSEALVLEAVDPLPVVRGSRVALRQVLLNLVANAVKHRGSHERVRVRVSATRRGDDGWEICVADDGRGVPDHLVDHVLRRGVQLDDSRPGAGLGLDLCRTLVEQHGGTLRLARSELGGLAVHLVLPAAPQPGRRPQDQ